jgi:PleD family two-component response regulator
MRIAPSSTRSLDLARVLVVHGDLAPRLTLRTILQAGGYCVDVAGSASEAVAKLDANRYELVLSDPTPGNHNLLAYAKVKAYRPATATVTSVEPDVPRRRGRGAHEVSIHTEDVPQLLGRVADLIGLRASRRYRQAG